jgi:hypothetical protein
MPVLYSLLTMSTASTATIAWPSFHARQGDLGRVLGGAERGVADGRVGCGAESGGEHDRGEEQPAG